MFYVVAEWNSRDLPYHTTYKSLVQSGENEIENDVL